MVVAQFDLARTGVQNNNRYAMARIVASNGSLLNTQEVTTNTGYGADSIYTIIGYDYASFNGTRTYSIQVKRVGLGSYGVQIRNAAIWAIEFNP